MFGDPHKITFLTKKAPWTPAEVDKILARMMEVSRLPAYPRTIKIDAFISREAVSALLGHNDFEHKVLLSNDPTRLW